MVYEREVHVLLKKELKSTKIKTPACFCSDTESPYAKFREGAPVVPLGPPDDYCQHTRVKREKEKVDHRTTLRVSGAKAKGFRCRH